MAVGGTAADEKTQQALDALRQMKQIRSQAGNDRKTRAKEKLERLKARLKMLRMFGGDGKKVARQAAEIAKQIAAAAKDYAASSGGDAGTASGGGDAGAASGGGDAGAASGGGDAGVPSGGDAAGVDQAAGADQAAGKGDAEPDTPAAGAEQGGAQAAAAPADGNPVQAPVQAAADGPRTVKSDGDAEFFREARTLAQQARNLIENARRRAAGQGPDADLQHYGAEAAAAEEAVAKAERDFAPASASASSAQPVNIVV
jgi:hypothetical protein